MTDLTAISKVVSVTPQLIELEVFDTKEYRQLASPLKIGDYIQVSNNYDGEHALVAVVRGFRVKDSVMRDATVDTVDGSAGLAVEEPQFIIGMQPVGIIKEGEFTRGANEISIPPKYIRVAPGDILETIYGDENLTSPLTFGKLAQDGSVPVNLDGNRFFGKHIGVVGSTGSGKSSTVAAILQEGIKRSSAQRSAGLKNNSHILIFDLHGEYPNAFPNGAVLDVDSILLPYWLMNSEELEELFIESNERNSHNQVSQFRAAVVANKRMHNPEMASVSYDDPVYFSLSEILRYLDNLNREIVYKEGEHLDQPKRADGSPVEDRFRSYFKEEVDFAPGSSAKGQKAAKGPFNGEFDRFLMRLKAKTDDSRLNFVLNPTLEDGSAPETEDLEVILRQLLGYEGDGVNVTIFDLSGVPFEVLSNVISLVSRLLFTFCMHRKRLQRSLRGLQDLPFLLVLEEAHNYISRAEDAKYKAVRKSIERVAKEGRKYGLSLMVVSQRPSEISETIFSQCSNFIAMRLTNPIDQNYVRRLLPDDVSAVTDSISHLAQREALVIGDAVAVPTLVRVNAVEHLPSSSDVEFLRRWREDWDEGQLVDTIEKMVGRDLKDPD